jgi:hypothetical protein
MREKIAAEIEAVADGLDDFPSEQYAGLLYAANIARRGADEWLNPEWRGARDDAW